MDMTYQHAFNVQFMRELYFTTLLSRMMSRHQDAPRASKARKRRFSAAMMTRCRHLQRDNDKVDIDNDDT